MFKKLKLLSWTLSQILIPLVLLFAPCVVSAKAQLWLYPDAGGSRSGGHIVEGNAFTLVLENRGTGNGDNIANDISILIAVNDPSLLTSISIGGAGTLNSGAFSFGTPVSLCRSTGISPHGVYPADFSSVPVGNLGPGETLLFDISVEGEEGLELHFDAIAIGYKTNGSGTQCYDVINPSGHDVTMIYGGDSSGDCAEVSIEKTGSSSGVIVGETVEYSIVVENTGTCELTNVIITENIPTVEDPDTGNILPVFTVLTTDPTPTSQTDELLTWELDNALQPEESVTVILTASFDQPLADTLEIINTACVEADELEELLCDEFSVAVGETTEDGHLGGPGFWCNRIRAALNVSPSATFSIEELELMLIDIEDFSTVYSEMEDISTLELAQVLLCEPNLADGAADKLLRHLLTLWLNVTNNSLLSDLLLSELCSGEIEIPEGIDPDMTAAALIEAAEADLLAGADDNILLLWKDGIEFVNSSSVPRANGCEPSEETTRTPSRTRGPQRRSGQGR